MQEAIEKMINEVENLDTAHALIEFTHLEYGWNWIYATLHEGKNGHFITAVCGPNIVPDWQADSFIEAVRQAGRELLMRLT